MSTETPTPRTNFAVRSCSIPIPRPLQITCEQLERENAELRKLLESMRGTEKNLVKLLNEDAAEIRQLREALNAMKP